MSTDIEVDPKTGKRYKLVEFSQNHSRRAKLGGKQSYTKAKKTRKYTTYDDDDDESYGSIDNRCTNLLESGSDDESEDNDNSKYKKRTYKSSNIKNSVATRMSEDNYVRPKLTATDMLSREDIQERLKNYEQVSPDDVEKIVPGTRVQYFQVDKNDEMMRYRPGGTVIVNQYPVYLVLSNGRKSWSVQLKNNIIFKEIDVDAIKKKYEERIKEKDREIAILRNHIINLKKDLVTLNPKKYDRY